MSHPSIPDHEDRREDGDLPDVPNAETGEAIDDDDDEIITCWCGAEGTYDELFDDDGLDDRCGGSGYLDCYCGGDQCVCHHHGQEVECPGCPDCGDFAPNDPDDDYDVDYDPDDAWDEAHKDGD